MPNAKKAAKIYWCQNKLVKLASGVVSVRSCAIYIRPYFFKREREREMSLCAHVARLYACVRTYVEEEESITCPTKEGQNFWMADIQFVRSFDIRVFTTQTRETKETNRFIIELWLTSYTIYLRWEWLEAPLFLVKTFFNRTEVECSNENTESIQDPRVLVCQQFEKLVFKDLKHLKN